MDGVDDQLTRAVAADAKRAPIATRAAMLSRQQIHECMSGSSNAVHQIEHRLACERAHRLALRWFVALAVVVVLGCYFGWLA